MKIEESELIEHFKSFLINEKLIDNNNSHFDGDNAERADVEITIASPEKWRIGQNTRLYIEAKSHHSSDSQNTINKIFGQLLKETGKRELKENECLAILFPMESAEWINNKKKTETRVSGEEYYRRGFSRIYPSPFKIPCRCAINILNFK